MAQNHVAQGLTVLTPPLSICFVAYHTYLLTLQSQRVPPYMYTITIYRVNKSIKNQNKTKASSSFNCYLLDRHLVLRPHDS